nr:hypothetical protein [Moritella viscosa]SHO03647.1 Argininosuccinate synthase-Citrulline--aspartate ligase [Moritella viscosa]
MKEDYKNYGAITTLENPFSNDDNVRLLNTLWSLGYNEQDLRDIFGGSGWIVHCQLYKPK